MTNGPDGMPTVEIVALRSSAAHFRANTFVPAVTLTELWSIASLKLICTADPGSISPPSAIAKPAEVTEVTRGSMVVVKVHSVAFIVWWPMSVRALTVTLYVVSWVKSPVGDHANSVWPESGRHVPFIDGVMVIAVCRVSRATGRENLKSSWASIGT